jgi:hypothetical protein
MWKMSVLKNQKSGNVFLAETRRKMFPSPRHSRESESRKSFYTEQQKSPYFHGLMDVTGLLWTSEWGKLYQTDSVTH